MRRSAPPPPGAPALGANLGILADWQGTNIFTNIIKQSRDALGHPDMPGVYEYGFEGRIQHDANGNPMSPFGFVIKEPMRPSDAGQYKLRFEGDADIRTFEGVTASNIRYDRASNRTTALLTVPPGAKIFVLGFPVLRSPVIKNMEQIKAEFDLDNYPVFRPEWIEHLRRFQVLRVMNWMCWWVRNPIQHWEERTRVEAWTQHATKFETLPSGERTEQVKGVAPEYIAELARATGSDIWINIPPFATDGYVRQLAILLHAQLPAGCKVYTEYGNELWAFGSWQADANRDLAVAEVQAGGSNLNFDHRQDAPWLWAWRRYARRTREIGDIFVSVFGAASRNQRIRPVLPYMASNPEEGLQEGLTFLEHEYGPPNQHLWGMAAAPYANIQEMAPTPVTKERLLETMEANIVRFREGAHYLEAGAAKAAWYGLQFAMYEGGVGIAPQVHIPREVAFEAMHDPRIKTIYEQYAAIWYGFGIDNLLCWFIAGASDWGGLNIFGNPDFYGLTWDISELNTYSIQAMDAILNGGGVFESTAGYSIGEPVATRNALSRDRHWEGTPLNEVQQGRQPAVQRFLIRAPKAGSYKLQLISKRGPRAVKTEIALNNAAVRTISIPAGTTQHKSTAIKVSLRKGMNVVQLKYTGGPASNYALQFSPA